VSALTQHPGAIDMGPVLEVVPAGAEARAMVTVPAPRLIVVDSFAPPADVVPTWGGRIPTITVDPTTRPLPRYSAAGFWTLVDEAEYEAELRAARAADSAAAAERARNGNSGGVY